MTTPADLLKNNVAWAANREKQTPGFFKHLSEQQKPKYMWIGCSDSRVPANEIVGLEPGQVFVHRNVGNQVHHTDLNCLSGVQFAVDVLKVEHIIVAGHYGCGAVQAAMESQHFGVVDNWIRGIRDNYTEHLRDFEGMDPEEIIHNMSELNVTKQVRNLSHTRIVQKAWEEGRPLSIHGWIYQLSDGLLRDLNVTRTTSDDIHPVHRTVPRL
ncbi:MAG: carbonic anhydrase [Zetaproteobacteria bacterium CG2_30_46_52]|nr:MAG: carbonic anhydrase [Zetaproteobacteria bacterium CG2_30_46_52]